MKRFRRQWQQRRTTDKYRSENITWTFGSCDFVWVFSRSLSRSWENYSLICRPQHCRWRAANFDFCSALMAIEHWGFCDTGHPFIMVISEHPCHSRILPSFYLFLRLRSATAGIRTSNFPHARRTLTFIKPIYLICTYMWFFRSPGWTRNITHQLESYFIF